MKKYTIIILILMHGMLLWAQAPATVSLDHNPVLRNESKKPVLKDSKERDTVSLPFIDDFYYYYRTPYPDQLLWMDKMVFINNDFPSEPRSNGVATFDALDANGKIYNPKNRPTIFYADTLTSSPIDLGEAGIANVYLSFFYQPQGIGDNPETADSLCLDFKTKKGSWVRIWDVPGTTVQPFEQVIIAVPSDYCYKGFQFRFMNKVSLDRDPFNPGRRGNVDHWHLDYVRLDKDRNANDLSIADVAMITPLTSLIKGYRAIPWKQFEVAYARIVEGQMYITYRNNDSNRGYLVDRNYSITDLYHSKTDPGGSSGAENILKDEVIRYAQIVAQPFDSPSTDSALFEVKSYLTTDSRDRKENDTVRLTQVFSNYFARDDGTPETGYGYEGTNVSGCAIACRYETFMPDSLQAVSLYFNPVANDTTSYYRFKIAVWKDDNGKPGEQIYLSTDEFSPKTTGQFSTYLLEKGIWVTQYYWIGWQQVTNGFLNVGFDLSYNDKGNLWYNSPGSWQAETRSGTLMIRPYLGKRKDFPTSVPDNMRMDIKVYPNPASDFISIGIDDTDFNYSDYNIEIFGPTGQLYYRKPFTGAQIDISRLKQGVYILRVTHKRFKTVYVQKLSVYR